MTHREIIDVQLEALYGFRFPQKIQALVDNELNLGRWLEGYDLAVTKGVATGESASELLRIVLANSPDLRIDLAELELAVAQELPQSQLADVQWVVDEGGSFALTDSLRVARFDSTSIIWRTPRISWDGIRLDSIENGLLHGRAWYLSKSVSPDAPFTLNFQTGEIIKGQVVEH